jgi:hypothetical protein
MPGRRKFMYKYPKEEMKEGRRKGECAWSPGGTRKWWDMKHRSVKGFKQSGGMTRVYLFL